MGVLGRRDCSLRSLYVIFINAYLWFSAVCMVENDGLPLFTRRPSLSCSPDYCNYLDSLSPSLSFSATISSSRRSQHNLRFRSLRLHESARRPSSLPSSSTSASTPTPASRSSSAATNNNLYEEAVKTSSSVSLGSKERECVRAVDLKFTSTLLHHLDNKLVYKLNDGSELVLRKLQYLDEVQDCAEFTVKTFFDQTDTQFGMPSNRERMQNFVQSVNPFRANNIQRLVEIQRKELMKRVEDPYSSMFVSEAEGIGVVGFSEIFVAPFCKDSRRFKDPMPTALEAERYDAQTFGQPKIANFCVDSNFRQQGVGRLLLAACLSQADNWGYLQALLLVDADNAAARRFYRRHGFHDIAYESSMRKYNVNSMTLSSVRSPKYLMQRSLATREGALL